jgi:hypothetical protein
LTKVWTVFLSAEGKTKLEDGGVFTLLSFDGLLVVRYFSRLQRRIADSNTSRLDYLCPIAGIVPAG